MWAYNKATAGTGGLAVLLLLEDEDLGKSAAKLLCLLPLPWLSEGFCRALQDLFEEMKKVELVS